jgi:glycosyltransferase involved in cell wall biosynthesis
MSRIPDRSRTARRASAAALRGASLVVANSRRAQRRCEELAGGPLRSTVIHLGTDLPDELPPKRERPTIVTLAHLVPRKRHAVVLHALATLQRRLELDYVVIGDGPGRAPLERLAASLGLGSHVHFLGQLDNPRAVAEMRRCHVCVMPGFDEPFGVAYVEAMAGGLPAIGSRGEGGPEDIASAGEGMVLVPPGDHLALAAAIEDIFTRGADALGAKARETVQRHFTWERCGRATVEAYEQALEASAEETTHA